MICYNNNGLAWRGVKDDYQAKDGEYVCSNLLTPEELLAQFPSHMNEKRKYDILVEISSLEKEVTQRRIRESLLTEEGKIWLEAQENQINTLRQEYGSLN